MLLPDATAAADAGGGAACVRLTGTDAPLPCDILDIVSRRCWRCHDTPEVTSVCEEQGTCFTGPFPLKTLADVHDEQGGRPIYELMYDAVSTGFMPLTSPRLEPAVQPLGDEEKSALLEWLAACAPDREVECARATDGAAGE
jgi:hypothetical protein